MFVLTFMRQTVRVPAEKFRLDIDQAITEELNLKFANKIVLNVGLCIALWDVTERGESFILPGDSGHHTKVGFRYVVFRPFMDELLVGKIKSSCKEYVQVSLGFFDDIIIPAENLMSPSRFVQGEDLWVWEYTTEDEKHDMYMDPGEEIRFKVVSEEFHDTTPSGPNDSGDDAKESNKKCAYRIIASINEPGLGLLSWWGGETEG
nr:EOG090X0DHL [Ilyocryptus agilis]